MDFFAARKGRYPVRKGRVCVGAHRDALEGDAFALDGLDEIHERGRAHHGNGLTLVGAEVHSAQAATEGLLGQDVAFAA